MSCAHAEQDGAYVLGALAPAERLDYEQHLAGCSACARSVRQLAGLPGLLAHVDPAVLEETPVSVVPPDLRTALVRRVRRERRRRTLLVAATAAALLVVATLLGALLGRGLLSPTRADQGSPAVAMRPVGAGEAPVRATLALRSIAEGTRLELACHYDEAYAAGHGARASTYELVVTTKDGHATQAGSWTLGHDDTLRVTAVTAARRSDIRSVEVRTSSNHPVLRLPG